MHATSCYRNAHKRSKVRYHLSCLKEENKVKKQAEKDNEAFKAQSASLDVVITTVLAAVHTAEHQEVQWIA